MVGQTRRFSFTMPDGVFLLFIAAGLIAELPRMSTPVVDGTQVLFRIGTVVLIGAVGLWQILARSQSSYLFAVFAHGLICLLLVHSVVDTALQGLVLFLPLTVSAFFYLSFPKSLLPVGVIHGLIIATRLMLEIERGAVTADIWFSVSGYLALNAAVAFFCVAFLRVRENYIEAFFEQERLEDVVDKLAKANMGYQDYAISAEERSGAMQRREISRDIHDIVGYTLTNTITLLEAVEHTMISNPLGVQRLVRLAKENAEEGLDNVRVALRELRSTDVKLPTGTEAIHRLVLSFQRATGVEVELSLDTDWRKRLPTRVEAIFFHVVQESMVNALRHGRATKIWVILRESASSVELSVFDNGSGNPSPTVGIGISGMRERVEEANGTLYAGGRDHGWTVRVIIPKAITASDSDPTSEKRVWT